MAHNTKTPPPVSISYTEIPNNESFALSLGIYAEREKELDELMDKCYEETNTYPQCIEMISPSLNNDNELAYIAFHLGAFAEDCRRKQRMAGVLMGILRAEG